MPVVKFSQPTAKSKGSCGDLANYLEKEDLQPNAERKPFFNHDGDNFTAQDVTQGIDSNTGQLRNDQDKYFEMSTNFSQGELEHLKELYPDKKERHEAIKGYQREIMEGYAGNFNKGLEGKDIRYYSKIEEQRRYKGTDPEVKAGKKNQGQLKQGDQTHVHTIISRKSNDNKKKLSPLTHHRATSKGAVKGGFDRSNFKELCEQAFDKRFNYRRSLGESFKHSNEVKKAKTPKELERLKKAEMLSSTQSKQKNKELYKRMEQRRNKQKGLGPTKKLGL